MLFQYNANCVLTPLYYLKRIKTNITHTLGDRMVSAVEHLCVGYYDAISKKKAWAHVNERNVLNYIMCPTVTKKHDQPIPKATKTDQLPHLVVL